MAINFSPSYNLIFVYIQKNHQCFRSYAAIDTKIIKSPIITALCLFPCIRTCNVISSVEFLLLFVWNVTKCTIKLKCCQHQYRASIQYLRIYLWSRPLAVHLDLLQIGILIMRDYSGLQWCSLPLSSCHQNGASVILFGNNGREKK